MRWGKPLKKSWAQAADLTKFSTDRQGTEQPPGLVCMSVTAKKQQCSAVGGFWEGE